jgi:hypothetical protein
MRTAYGPKVVVDGGKVIAVSLGSDQCAEHEWGIDKLRRDFNCNDNPLVVGLDDSNRPCHSTYPLACLEPKY